MPSRKKTSAGVVVDPETLETVDDEFRQKNVFQWQLLYSSVPALHRCRFKPERGSVGSEPEKHGCGRIRNRERYAFAGTQDGI
jgi:hypothetical protein